MAFPIAIDRAQSRAAQYSSFRGTLAAAALLGLSLMPSAASACACGCGIFDVGTSSLFASGTGGTVFFEYDFVNQRANRSGTSAAPSAANEDKKVRTDFFTVGGQYMFSRDWGAMVKVPVVQRHFETTESGSLEAFDHTALGDIRLMGVYSGISDDMSTGIVFGAKLPTGDSGYAGFDADVAIGSGSTDLLLGAYHMGGLDAERNWAWFAQAMWDQPLLHKSGYRPGAEINATLGAYYDDLSLGGETALAPMLQLIVSHRAKDSGAGAMPADTGYDRVLIAPGLEFKAGTWKIYADVEVPLYQDVRGNQLMAPEQFKLVMSYAL